MESNNSGQNQEPHAVWSSPVRYIALVCLIVLAVYVGFLFRGSLMLVLVAAIIAYLLNPVVRFFNKKLHLKWRLSIAIAYILLILLIIGAISFVIPWLTDKVINFFTIDWPQVLAAVDEYLTYLVEEIDAPELNIGGFIIDLSEPLLNLQNSIHSAEQNSIGIHKLIPDMQTTLRRAFSISTNVVGRIFGYFIAFATMVMASIYMCRDGNQIAEFVLNIFEEKYQPEIKELMHRMRLIWDRYFVNELKLMVYIGLITTLIYWGMGLHWPILLGVIAGFLEVVPNIGPILATIPAVISALIFGSSWIPLNNILIGILVVVASIVIQQTENLFLVPHIMGNALELHPLVIIIGIMVLSSSTGAVGAIIAAPLIGLSKEILYYIIKKVKKQDPYPELYPD